MSTITCFFAGTMADAGNAGFTEFLDARSHVLSKNITPDVVGDLDFVLTGCRTREPQCVREEEGLTVFRLDGELTAAIAAIRDDELRHVADEWGVADIEGTVELLTQLRRLAEEAVSKDEGLFLCF